MSSHTVGDIIETGTYNSQTTARLLAKTDVLFIPPMDSFITTTASNWVANRRGNGQWNLRHSNTDETSVIGIPLTSYTLLPSTAISTSKNERTRGIRLNAIAFIFINPSTGGSALDAAPTLACYQQTFAANNAAFAAGSAVAVTAATAAVTTASDTNSFRPRWTFDTPPTLGTSDVIYAELTINSSATSDLEWYGTLLECDYLL